MKVWDALDIHITREEGDLYRVVVNGGPSIGMVVRDSLDVKLDDLIVTLALRPVPDLAARSLPWWHWWR